MSNFGRDSSLSALADKSLCAVCFPNPAEAEMGWGAGWVPQSKIGEREEKGGKEFRESEVIDKMGSIGADFMNELLCCLVECLGILCHTYCMAQVQKNYFVLFLRGLEFQMLNCKFNFRLNCKMFSDFYCSGKDPSMTLRSNFVIFKKSFLLYVFYTCKLYSMKTVEFLWTPWESKYSQLLVGSRLPANQNSEHHVLLLGETCLPKFLASKHRHVEFVRVAICLSTANSTTVIYLLS